MTRINVVPPQELCDQHLLAEWRELPRMAGLAAKTRNHATPSEYCLGTGHMMFFLDKGVFLEQRHAQLTAELRRRGFNLGNYAPFRMPATFGRRDYTPTLTALRLNRERIALRMPTAPRYAKEVV